LQEPAERLCPEVNDLRGRLAALKPAGQLMSGSGTSVFAVCRDSGEPCGSPAVLPEQPGRTTRRQPDFPRAELFLGVPQNRRNDMVITEVRIKLMEDNSENERLQAFCSVTFDDAFVVRDLKIIEGTKGSFVAMPSRKLTDRCSHCGCKNHLRSRFCNQCGSKLDEDRATRDAGQPCRLHADVAHPINSACREVIQGAVLKAFNEEKERSKQPATSARTTTTTRTTTSFGSVVGEMTNRGGYRTHGAHGSSRGTHAAPRASRPATTSAARTSAPASSDHPGRLRLRGRWRSRKRLQLPTLL
jgi:stage V sporulation protein G